MAVEWTSDVDGVDSAAEENILAELLFRKQDDVDRSVLAGVIYTEECNERASRLQLSVRRRKVCTSMAGANRAIS